MTPEIYTHIGFLTFIESLVTANPNIDAFYRLDLAEIMKSAHVPVVGNPRVIFVLERNEKRTLGDNNSQVHENRTIAFLLLKVSKPGSYNDHDAIFDEMETIGINFLDQIETYQSEDDALNVPTNDILHVFRNSISIHQIGPWLGSRYGVRIVFQMVSKGRPVVDL